MELLVGIGTAWVAAAAALTFGIAHALAHEEAEARGELTVVGR